MKIKNLKVNLPAIFACFILLSCEHKNTIPPAYTIPVSDTVLVQYGTPFSGVPDPENAVIYEVNMRAFSAQGNFQGVIARLDSVKALSVNVIYLMPIYPVGIVKSVNSPYCVKDYLSVNSEFGTLSDLRALVDGAHSRNMSVMLDWVANHTSWDNAWITTHPDWYAHDASGNIVSPSGYTDVAQLDYTNAAMRLQMIADMKSWIYTANVDGFRCDFADNIPDDFWAQDIDTLRNISTHKLLLLAEGSRSGNYTAGFNYNFGFNFYGDLKKIYSSNIPVTSIDALNTSDYAGASGEQQIVRYTTNHDVNSSDGTPVSLFAGNSGSMAAFAAAALMKSVPFIYNGQEVGMTTPITFPFTTVKIDWSTNIPMTALYKSIINFRTNNDAVRKGALTSYSTADVCAFTKISGSNEVFVIVNMRGISETFAVPSGLQNSQWKNSADGSAYSVSTQISLQPYQYLLLQNQ